MSTDSSRKTRWTYEAYAAIPSDGKSHEIIDGDHFVNPAPNLYHQQISRRIQFILYTQIEQMELGVVINSPVDVQLSEYDILQPDLVVITKPNFHIMTPIKIKGIPDLLIEILSPSTRNHDLRTKRTAYERCGVPEYWIVFPEEHQVLQLVLEGGEYRENICHDEIVMRSPPHASVDLRKVW